MMRTLVTGGAGFLGSHLCDYLLDREHEVICLDNFSTASRRNIRHLDRNPDFEVIRHDVVSPLPLEVDQIFHLACPASPVHYQRDPVKTIRTAVQGTLNMLDLARDTGACIVITSTSEVYGDPQEHPQRETYWGHVNPVGPRACYDEGKRCAEALAASYALQYGVSVRIARVFNTYGPRMRADDGRVVSNFITQALHGEPLTLYGDGSQTRSFCFVSDLIDGLLRLGATSEDPGPVNLGRPAEHTIHQLAQMVIELVGSESAIQLEPLPVDDPQHRCPDIGKAREVLGWEPLVTLEQGLRMTLNHFKLLEGSLNA